MIAILAFSGMRLKNFAHLEIGTTFKEVQGHWWIEVPARKTKPGKRREDRPVPQILSKFIGAYLKESRPVLIGTKPARDSLWVSSTTGKSYTQKNLGILISRLTRETLGVDVSPHLFRTALATTAAVRGARYPHFASALLNHSDPRVTEEHYIRATNISAARTYAEITRAFLEIP